MKSTAIFTLLAGAVGAFAATAGEWAQCGGTGFTGPTTCSSGFTCYCQSQYYSQCLKSDPGWTGCGSSTGSKPPSSSPSAVSPTPKKAKCSSRPATPIPKAPVTPSSPGTITQGTCEAHTGSKSGFATTTHYYDGQVGACGCSSGGAMSSWQKSAGTKIYTAAGSQSLFGGSGSWCGSGCGKCYQLTNVGSIAASGQGDCTGAEDTITVMVTNLCPADGNAVWCSQPSNQFGYGAHFDIMSEGGPLGWNNPVVKYSEVACPTTLKSNFATCQCAKGATSRARRNLVDMMDM